MHRPLLVIFTGVPGSGKTFFATRLSQRLGAVRRNSDAMRLAIFGDLKTIENTYHSAQRATLNTHTFGALDYVTRELLGSGTDVVYETIQRTQKDRRHMEILAEECGARLVLVSMEIDDETAISRVQKRKEARDVRQFDAKKAREVINYFREGTEPFERTDYIVNIDGTAAFDEQYAAFMVHVKERENDQ